MHDDGCAQVGATDHARHPEAGPLNLGECPNPARVIEMAYLSQEPGLLEIIRAIACLPVATRAVLEEFLSTAPDAGQIYAARHQGQLVLSALHIAAPSAAAEGRQAE